MRSLALVLALLPAVAWAEPRTIAGEARWRDGDTAVVSGVPVRLSGLHAPELREPGGGEAKRWMEAATRGQVVTCVLDGSRTRDRWAGICTIMSQYVQIDLAAGLISAGLGRDCPRHSRGRYRHLERPEAVRFGLPAYCLLR